MAPRQICNAKLVVAPLEVRCKLLNGHRGPHTEEPIAASMLVRINRHGEATWMFKLAHVLEASRVAGKWRVAVWSNASRTFSAPQAVNGEILAPIDEDALNTRERAVLRAAIAKMRAA